MKRFRHIAVCVAGGLVLSTGLCADNGVLQKNPYEAIATRNIFGLNPPRARVDSAESSSKITPDGIMAIFGGTPQVLFKVVSHATPPMSPTEKSCILSEGQRQDDIEVTHIDVKTGVVTFNNHGVVQEIPLVKASSLTTPIPVAPMPLVMHPGRIPPVPYKGGVGMARFGNRSVPDRGMENNGGHCGNSEQ